MQSAGMHHVLSNLCEAAIEDGYVVGHPCPTSFDITNPFIMIQELAVVLGQYCRLDGTLIDAYPKVETDEGSSDIPGYPGFVTMCGRYVLSCTPSNERPELIQSIELPNKVVFD